MSDAGTGSGSGSGGGHGSGSGGGTGGGDGGTASFAFVGSLSIDNADGSGAVINVGDSVQVGYSIVNNGHVSGTPTVTVTIGSDTNSEPLTGVLAPGQSSPPAGTKMQHTFGPFDAAGQQTASATVGPDASTTTGSTSNTFQVG